MLTVITGQPCPDLEAALRSSLSEWRSRADFSRALVVVPSDEMRRHLKLLIGRGWGECFLGLRLVTAQGLARSILDAGRADRGVGEAADAALLEELVRGLLRSGEFPRLRVLAETSGGPAALLTTLFDLTEACVPADRSEKDEVLRLYAEFDRRRRETGLVTYTDLVREAASAAGGSAFLAGLSETLYYGFYDMTGAQSELLASVARAARVTFFLPLGDGPSYEFPRAFGGRVLEPLAERVEPAPRAEDPRPLVEPALSRLFEPTAGQAGETPRLGTRPRVISVSGTEAELEAAAREVLRLVEEEGLAWGDVAVIARTLGPYVPYLESVLGERRIPFRSSAGLPAGVFPAAEAVHALVRVLSDGMRRADVIDLVSSPRFDRRRFGVGEGRGSYWDVLSRQLRIVGGETQWAKLKPIVERGARRVRRQDEGEIALDVEAAKDLWKCVDPLIDACATFPERGTWQDFASAFERAFEGLLELSDADPRELGLLESLRAAARDMHRLGAVSKGTSRAEFLLALERRLGGITAPFGDDRADAVEVLDATAARCRSFRGVVVIGLDGQKFPPNVEQDPFLPDDARGALAKKYTVRLARKAGRFDEERLLFHLAVAAAREHLTLVHQRSDDDGKPLVRSWYLDDLERAAGGAAAFDELRVPRLFADQLRLIAREDPASLAYLTPREWRHGLVIEGARERRLWDLVSGDAGMLERALGASDELARPGKRLGPRDGITGPLPRFFEEMKTRGFSPTGLEKYAACPFAFFARKVLGLEEVKEAEVAFEPGALEVGTVLHRLLEVFFRRLVEKGYFAGRKGEAREASLPSTVLDKEALLTEAAEAVFKEAEPRIAGASPLMWEREKANLLRLAREYAERELARLEGEGWVPVDFEVKDVSCVSDSEASPENVRSLKLYGFVDRLDRREVAGQVEARVVDYKFKSGGTRSPVDNNLARGAVRGQRLQPPVYLLMARDILKQAAHARAEFHFIAPNWPDGPVVVRDFPPDCWSTELGRQVARALSRLVEGISRGEWFPVPGRHCDYCEFPTICRKSHRPTRYRLAADARAASLADLSKEQPLGGSSAKKAKKAKKARGKRKKKMGGS